MASTSRSRSPSRSDEVEVAHYWGEGDGGRMFEALLEEFRSRHPEVTVHPQAYDNHGLAIKSRILREDPPPVFVEWPDRNLVPYHDAGALHDLTELWEAEGWTDAYIEGPMERAKLDGEFVAVPVNIHRMNNLFYHVDLVEKLGIQPERIEDPRAFLDVLRDVEAEGRLGLVQPMMNPQMVLMLWANVFIGQFGAAAFEELTRGNSADYESELRESLELLAEFADLASEDASFLDMVGANERFLNRRSVFFFQGDWVAGEYETKADFEYGEDWDAVPFPGTDDVYMIGSDSFVASADVDLDGAVETFLKFVGSPAAQERLNRVKGSIPPRSDVSMDSFPAFLQDQFADFERARHFPAGQALQVEPDAFVGARAAMSDFLTGTALDEVSRRFVDAYH